MKKLNTGLYINEDGKLVDIVGWGYNYSEYEVQGVYQPKELEFTYNIRTQWEE